MNCPFSRETKDANFLLLNKMISWQGLQVLPQAEDALWEFIAKKFPSSGSVYPYFLWQPIACPDLCGFLENVFFLTVIVLVSMGAFLQHGKGLQDHPIWHTKFACCGNSRAWPEQLMNTFSLVQRRGISTSRNPRLTGKYQGWGEGQHHVFWLAGIIPDSSSWWSWYFLGQILLKTAAMGNSFQCWWETLFHK